jgi:hypothetical protein
MASWSVFAQEQPSLEAAVRARFDAHRHSLLATLDREGAPRLSGIETPFWAGELWLAMMPASVKAADLRRDPRFALHCAPIDLTMTDGDAKVAGRAVEVTDPETVAGFSASLRQPPPPSGMALFRADLASATLTRVEGSHLVIETWRPGAPVARRLVA